jgi:hypothetical protein
VTADQFDQPLRFVAVNSDALAAVLGLSAPPFVEPARAFEQLESVYAHAKSLGCVSLCIEREYIDRDYMEDHSVFYSKSLHPSHKNRCRRVHFFRGISYREIEPYLREIVEHSRAGGESRFDIYRSRCREFSESHYLGFAVIKPLRGSPVGRTVLVPPPEASPRPLPGFVAHLLGVELHVSGVPFQQQDVGVSACATTALWSSLSVSAAMEPLGHAAPAQITTLAAKDSLPFGRAMPSEGLNTAQMCQAVQALGAAPSLLRADDYEDARGYLYSALRSGLAPVLVLNRESSLDAHAVAAVGMILDKTAPIVLSDINPPGSIGDVAGRLKYILVHDDAAGPYRRSKIDLVGDRKLELELIRTSGPEPWRVTQILIPSHQKIRLSFAILRDLSLKLAAKAYIDIVQADQDVDGPVIFEHCVLRGHEYVHDLVLDPELDVTSIQSLVRGEIALPRYVGIVRLSSRSLDDVDILIDTTSTSRNLHFVAILARKRTKTATSAVVSALANALKDSASNDVPIVG